MFLDRTGLKKKENGEKQEKRYNGKEAQPANNAPDSKNNSFKI